MIGEGYAVDLATTKAEAWRYLDTHRYTNNDNWLSAGELTSATKVTTSSSSWNTPVVGNEHSAAVLHNQLDSYNNNGTVFGTQFAKDGDLVV